MASVGIVGSVIAEIPFLFTRRNTPTLRVGDEWREIKLFRRNTATRARVLLIFSSW